MISHFWFRVLETVDIDLNGRFGFTAGDKLKVSALQVFCLYVWLMDCSQVNVPVWVLLSQLSVPQM